MKRDGGQHVPEAIRTWVLRVYAGRDPLTGKKVWKSRTFQGTKREADRALAAFVAEQPSAQAPAPSRTFGELLERWFEAGSGDWSPSTARQTRWVINGNLKGLSDRKVSAIGAEDLDRFYAALRERGGRGGRPLDGSTVVRTHTIVRLALSCSPGSSGWQGCRSNVGISRIPRSASADGAATTRGCAKFSGGHLPPRWTTASRPRWVDRKANRGIGTGIARSGRPGSPSSWAPCPLK
jgi:hypothetical protein